MIKDVVTTVKNIWFLAGTAIAGSASVLAYIQSHSVTIEAYDVEIGVGLFFVLFFSGCFAYYRTHNRITIAEDKTTDALTAIKASIEAESRDRKIAQLEADIERFFYTHIVFDTLRLDQVQRLHALEKRRVELCLNSFSEYKLSQLFKIPAEEEYRS